MSEFVTMALRDALRALGGRTAAVAGDGISGPLSVAPGDSGGQR